MNKQLYKDKWITAAQAAAQVRSGDRIVFGHAAAEPTALIDALTARARELKDVEPVHMVCMGKAEYCLEEYKDHFRHNSLFVGGAVRKAVFEGRADYTPIHFSLIPTLFTDGYLPVDIAFLQASPPDKHGYMSLGISADYGVAAAKCAKKLIVQVNRHMPRTHGEVFIHVRDCFALVEADAPLIELGRPELTEVERKIGQNCGSLISDGATLQLGIGSLPDAVLLYLQDKNDLGIHSEMISDGVLDLYKAGVVNNKKKTLHNGKFVITFIMGTRELYDFVDDNPAVYMAPVTYVNDPYVIAQNDNLISINSCVQVDLMGQVCSESVGLMQISAVGGQIDFVRGANLAKGGKSIIALPSTAKNDAISKIVPFLDHGAAVTTPRTDVRYIITEYGIAHLFGKTLRQRASALIGIAHPNFRPGLIEEYERRFKMSYSAE